jgi:disulfide bond formation protein DsbB
MMKLIKQSSLLLAWLVAVIATMGSLFFSNVLHLTPCLLCWYQRICMYPLAAILTVGILLKDKKVWAYVLPLVSIGLLVSVYHNLLYYNIIPEATAPCTAGISCTTRQIEWLGFTTIPLLSLVAFVLISFFIIIYYYSKEQEI